MSGAASLHRLTALRGTGRSYSDVSANGESVRRMKAAILRLIIGLKVIEPIFMKLESFELTA